MKTGTLIGLGALTLSGLTFYNNYMKKDDGDGGDGGFFEVLTGGSGKTETILVPETKKSVKYVEIDGKPYSGTPSSSSGGSSDFKMSILENDYKNHINSGSKKSRKYVENTNLDLVKVVEDGKTVGGFDFKYNASITAEGVKQREAGAVWNKAISGGNSTKKSLNYTPAPKKEDDKKSSGSSVLKRLFGGK